MNRPLDHQLDQPVDHPVKTGIYEHYKGKRYRVLGTARHSETLEELVLYECLYPNDLGQIWIRPKALFFGRLTVDGRDVQRFRPVSEP